MSLAFHMDIQIGIMALNQQRANLLTSYFVGGSDVVVIVVGTRSVGRPISLYWIGDHFILSRSFLFFAVFAFIGISFV